MDAQLILEGEISREELMLCEQELAGLEHGGDNQTVRASNGNTTTASSAKLDGLHVAESVLRFISLTILFLFLVELLMLVVVFGKYFFRHVLYVIDLVIVSITVGLELGLNRPEFQEVAGILVFIRLWRLVRAGHGVMSIQAERSIERTHKLIVKNAELKAEVSASEVQVIALERLLDEFGILHPGFSQAKAEEPKKHEHHLEPEENALVESWLREAEAENWKRVEQQIAQVRMRGTLKAIDELGEKK